MSKEHYLRRSVEFIKETCLSTQYKDTNLARTILYEIECLEFIIEEE